MVRQQLGLALRHNKDRVRIVRESIIDASRHLRYSAAIDERSARTVGVRQMEAQITKDYHRIEKGLSLAQPRRRFGLEVMARLRRDLARYRAQADHDPVVVGTAESALDGLQRWHSSEVIEDPGPTRVHTPYVGLPKSVANEFFKTRASVRNFSSTPLAPVTIESAVEYALATPSVCNRQAWGVWSYHDRASIDKITALQNGNAGFGQEIPCLLIVTTDARLFAGSGERNQRWIDGGLFAMSLVWGLHSLGVATCMLNWSVDNDRTQQLRRLTGLPANLDIIALIAVGYPRDGLRVARSPRRPVSSVLHIAAPVEGSP
jgi:nitroreductase